MAKCKNCKHLKIDSATEKKVCFLIGEIGSPDEEISCCCYRSATNADRIRSMTDEELMEWINGFGGCVIPREECLDKYCDKCILKWLKSEVGCE